MRPFKRPPTLTPYCSKCFNRSHSTTVTATNKRRKVRVYQKQIDQSLQDRASTLRTRIHEARTVRREDWILGPLAPRRDIGDGQYGTVTKRDLKGVTKGLARGVLTKRDNGGVTATGKSGKKGVGMSWEQSLIYEGDRVAIMSVTGPESRDKGEIGTVTEVRKGTREVVIEGLNMVCLPTSCCDCRSEMATAITFLFSGRGFVGLFRGLSIPLAFTYEQASNPTVDS